MSLSGAFADERAVTAGHLSYPPALADFDDAERVSVDVEAPSVQPVAGPDFDHLYSRSPVMYALCDQIGKVSDTLVTVLIIGESGTGRELIACMVHDMSPRTDQTFIAVNCGTISPNPIESELSGYEKDSFTGASQCHIGYFEHACDGTIFPDEITEMSVEMQMKLLRMLETGVFMRVGDTKPTQTHARIIAATNHSLLEAVNDGAFHEDLMCHLAVVPLHVLPLRNHGDDIEELVLYFLAQFNATHQTDKVFSCQALATLRTQTWPGSVQKLRNAVHRSYILGEKTIGLAASLAQTRGPARPTVKEGVLSLSVGVTLADAQRAMVMTTLEHFHGNRCQTTKTLGIGLKTLHSRLDLYQNTAAAAMAA